MSDSMLDFIFCGSTRRLDEALFQSAEYKKTDREVSRQFRRMEKMKLSRKQNRAVDELLTACNAENACCCRIFYKQGFKDCISLLKELGVF